MSIAPLSRMEDVLGEMDFYLTQGITTEGDARRVLDVAAANNISHAKIDDAVAAANSFLSSFEKTA